MANASFTADVDRKIALLREGSLTQAEAELAAKRAAWARERLGQPDAATCFPPTPQGAAKLFLREYLGLPDHEVPVVSQSPTEVRWRSENPCDTLEACRALGRDPRVVCRALYEKPVQWLISQLSPQLRFERSYQRIRPHAQDCEERIVAVSFDAWMDRAIDEARRSRSEGNKGYGAVVTCGDQVIAQAHDTAGTTGDPTLHAELSALRDAARILGDANLAGCVLLCTCEPCPMCAAAAVWANVTTVVFGASIAETVALGKSRIQVPVQHIIDRSPATIEVIGGVQRDRCLALYR